MCHSLDPHHRGRCSFTRHRRAAGTAAHATSIPCKPVHTSPSGMSVAMLRTARLDGCSTTVQSVWAAAEGRIVGSSCLTSAVITSECERAVTARDAVCIRPIACSGGSSTRRVRHGKRQTVRPDVVERVADDSDGDDGASVGCGILFHSSDRSDATIVQTQRTIHPNGSLHAEPRSETARTMAGAETKLVAARSTPARPNGPRAPLRFACWCSPDAGAASCSICAGVISAPTPSTCRTPSPARAALPRGRISRRYPVSAGRMRCCYPAMCTERATTSCEIVGARSDGREVRHATPARSSAHRRQSWGHVGSTPAPDRQNTRPSTPPHHGGLCPPRQRTPR